MKKSILTFLLGITITFLISGCASSGYKDFYKSSYNESTDEYKSKNPHLEFLKNNEEPKVYTTDNFERDVYSLRTKQYIPIGQSDFNGEMEDEKAIIEQAKRVGAKIVLYGSKYTNTQTNSGVLMLPKTNYSTTNIYGNVGGTMYSGTAYTQSSGTQMVPYSNTQRRYDQTGVFFVKDTNNYKFGIYASQISREKRIEIGSFGVNVDVVIENTPAYNSDLLRGDIIIGVNDNTLNDYNSFLKGIKECITNKMSCHLKVNRNGEEKNIIVNF